MNKNKYSSLKNMGTALLFKRSGAELEKNIKIKNKKRGQECAQDKLCRGQKNWLYNELFTWLLNT